MPRDRSSSPTYMPMSDGPTCGDQFECNALVQVRLPTESAKFEEDEIQ